MTLHIILPGLLAAASEELKRKLVPAILRGDIIACQLFSEPGAGSDLSAVSTRAVRDGGEWVVAGQKVWTTGGHYSDIGLLLARTGDDAVPHRRLTMFVADMHDPAIEVRPLREMSGGAHFNEVFIDALRIPDSHRVGDVNKGWGVAIATLGGERKAVGNSSEDPNWVVVERLVDLAAVAAKKGNCRPRSLTRSSTATFWAQPSNTPPRTCWQPNAEVIPPDPRCPSSNCCAIVCCETASIPPATSSG